MEDIIMSGAIYVGLPIGIIIVIALVFLVLSITRRIKLKNTKKQLDPIFLEQLYLALGGAHNMIKLSTEHKRLKVTVNEVKKIDANQLKALAIPVFMSGRELKLLIKENITAVESYLIQRRKEEL
jgi:phosphotransferase system IIB component